MKPNCVPAKLSAYRVRWQVGDRCDAVDHLVVARNAAQARRISATAVRRAVRAEFQRWKIESVS